MILVGSQRGGAGNLARHLLNDKDNDHVTVQELRGFTARDLLGAFEEAHAVSTGTKCKQFLFSLSFNPPKDADVPLDALMAAMERAEQTLGLTGQPRAVVVHEKNGRRHMHAVWSRIDAATMKAVELPFFKNRLKDLSRQLFLDHGWELPEGHRENGWKNPLNFSLAEWQQAKRLGLDPREIKQVFQSAWAHSDNLASFGNALEEHGYYLARGDRRGFVAVDVQGEVHSVSRMAGVKTKDVNERLGDPTRLSSVETVQTALKARLSQRLKDQFREQRAEDRKAVSPLEEERARMVEAHRAERALLAKKQEERLVHETRDRSARLRTGLRGLLDKLTGRGREIRQQNDREAFAGYRRDVGQREAVFKAQMQERQKLQFQLDAERTQRRQGLMKLARQVATLLRGTRGDAPARQQSQQHKPRNHGFEIG